MDRVTVSPLTRRVGIGAGILLLLLIIAAAIPPLVVEYKLHEFEGRLHAGMTQDQVKSVASSLHLSQTASPPDVMAFPVPRPWTISSPCSDDYLVIVALKNNRVDHWSRIKEHLCLNS
jgi:hypothetical protein